MVKLLIGATIVLGGWLSSTRTPRATPRRSNVVANGNATGDGLVTQQQQGICCCQTFSQRWQYNWTTPAACTQSRGSCVSPDHCG